jgi:Sugar (and other) transporter
MALVRCMPFASENIDNGRLVHARSNFVVAITFPRLLGAFKPQGAFGWYAAWNIVGFFAILLFVPETKALSLEELDQGECCFPDGRCLACFSFTHAHPIL